MPPLPPYAAAISRCRFSPPLALIFRRCFRCYQAPLSLSAAISLRITPPDSAATFRHYGFHCFQLIDAAAAAIFFTDEIGFDADFELSRRRYFAG